MTTQRERYRDALAALEQARQQVTRDELIYQLNVTRLRQADVEGFEVEATHLEARNDELAQRLEADRQQVAVRAREAEELRILATIEEIDEVIGTYDQALRQLWTDAERLATAIAEAAAIAHRAEALAADLPATITATQRTVAAAVAQSQALDRLAAHLLTTLTQVDLPPAPSGLRAED